MKIHRAANLMNLPTIAHGFFGRDGGVSQGVYASLNCGPGSRDDPKAVAENRARASAALGSGLRLVTLGQIHSAIVHPVGAVWDFGVKQEGDGLVTDRLGVALGILTADCAPVLFADPEASVIGAAHAGWKGAVAGVLENTVAVMEKLGARRGQIVAAIGPAISQANYEVGADMRARFDAGDDRFFTPGRAGHFHFDLPGYAAHRLRRAGVEKIADLGLCTYPMEAGFFSFRRTTHRGEADYGRELSAIALVPKNA
jgi:purine-nucleoside/S-methyl-5'-thioadenosine phosphorylase / adenosine deaminase